MYRAASTVSQEEVVLAAMSLGVIDVSAALGSEATLADVATLPQKEWPNDYRLLIAEIFRVTIEASGDQEAEL